MGPSEARLRCMLKDPDSREGREMLARWELSSADRDAIRWAFDRIATLENDLAESRKIWMSVSADFIQIRERLEDVTALIQKPLDRKAAK